MEKKRPIGVTVFGIIGMVFYAFIFLLAAFGSFLGNASLSDSVFAFISLLFGISLVISGIFIIMLRRWARILFIFQMCLIGTLAGLWLIIAIITKQIDNSLIFFLTFVIFFLFLLPICCIYYLTRPKVKEQFK